MDAIGPDERAFLTAIAATPAADLPRLAYADWLDEHGRALRAEFIRLQCEIETKSRLPRREQDRYVGLWMRQAELLEDYHRDVAGPAGFLPAAAVAFERGFVSEVKLHVGAFLKYDARLAGLTPLPRISVTNVADRLTDYFECPFLGCVTAVAMYDADIATQPLAEFPSPGVLQDVARRSTRLKVLDLEACQLGDGGVEVLGTASFPALADLDLSNNDVTDQGVRFLLNSGLLHRLSRIVLGGNPITDGGAIELADRLGDSPHLEQLNLRFTNIGLAGQQALLPRFGSRVDLF